MLRDRRAINERFDELQRAIKEEILVFTKPPYATPPQDEHVGLEVTQKHDARSVYELSVFDDPAVAAGVRRFIETGEKARFVQRAAAQARDHRRVDRHVRDGGPGRRRLRADDDGGRPPLARARSQDRLHTLWEQGLTFDEASAAHDLQAAGTA